MAQPPHCPQQICQALKGAQFEAPGLIGAGMVESFHIQDESGFSFALPFYKNRGIGFLAESTGEGLTLQLNDMLEKFTKNCVQAYVASKCVRLA